MARSRQNARGPQLLVIWRQPIHRPIQPPGEISSPTPGSCRDCCRRHSCTRTPSPYFGTFQRKGTYIGQMSIHLQESAHTAMGRPHGLKKSGNGRTTASGFASDQMMTTMVHLSATIKRSRCGISRAIALRVPPTRTNAAEAGQYDRYHITSSEMPCWEAWCE